MAVAVYGDSDVFRAMRFGAPREEDRLFLREHIEEAASRLGRGADEFLGRVRERFESFDLKALDRKLDALKRKVQYGFAEDRLRPLRSIGEYQQVGPVVQRFLMAHPRTRRLARSDRCAGYRETYVDHYPNRHELDHPDYLRVINGLHQFDEEGNVFFVQDFDALDSDEREELSFSDQVLIRDVLWQGLDVYLDAGGDDPVDPNNGSL